MSDSTAEGERLAAALDAVVARTPVLDRPALVGVDGVDGSGKTTAAAALASRYVAGGRPCLVVHLDDFLNPRAVRHRLGRDSPEGFYRDTYDLETFAALVLEPLARPGPWTVTPRAFDHRTDLPLDEPAVPVPADAVVVVEGMFLHREALRSCWDLSVFLDVPFTITARRMAARDGTEPDPTHPSMRRYVGGQQIYLTKCRPRTRAVVVVDDA